MLVYLAGDSDRLEELERSVREYMGWSEILAREDDLDLTASQKNQAKERQRKASETADARLLAAYQWALVPRGQPIEIDAIKVEGQSTSLAERISRRLGNDGRLAVQHAAAAIRLQLENQAAKLWESGHLPVGELWRLYAEYPYMPRLRDRAVLEAGLTGPQLLWEQEGFALADGYDEEVGRYHGLVLPSDDLSNVNVTDATLIVKPEPAKVQRAAELAEAGEAGGAPADAGVDAGGEADTPVGPGTGDASKPKPAGNIRYFGSKQLEPDRHASDFKKLADEILAPLAAADGVELKVTVEIEATTADGFDEAKVRTVSENASTLKFEESGFEEG